MNSAKPSSGNSLLGLVTVLAMLLTACQTAQSPPPAPQPPMSQAPPAAVTAPPIETPPAPAVAAAPAPAPAPPIAVPRATPRPSQAGSAREYRRDAAGHIYALHRERIFSGKLPPMLYAVAVLDVELNARGEVTGLNWLRAPRHAPQVMAEIESMVRAAAPFPAPQRLRRVTYTDTWLWDRSGRFQLDTLTEGQL